MFFFLSKTIGLLTKPFSWIFILLALAVFIRKPRLKKIFLITAFIILVVFSNPWLNNITLKMWEPAPVRMENVRTYDIGIVLGGFSKYFPEYDRVELTEAGDRLWQTLSLYQQGKIKKILVSGGTGRKGRKPEAEAVRELLIAMGIPDSAVIAETRSRNTYENAQYSKELIDSVQPGAGCLLITSALHMPRSLACFRKAGLHPDAYPAEHITRREQILWAEWLVPKPEVLYEWSRIFNEWVGIIVYKIQGYI